jgi:hypothetical protein
MRCPEETLLLRFNVFNAKSCPFEAQSIQYTGERGGLYAAPGGGGFTQGGEGGIEGLVRRQSYFTHRAGKVTRPAAHSSEFAYAKKLAHTAGGRAKTHLFTRVC